VPLVLDGLYVILAWESVLAMVVAADLTADVVLDRTALVMELSWEIVVVFVALLLLW